MNSRDFSLLYIVALFALTLTIVNCSAGGKFTPSIGSSSLGTSSNNPPAPQQQSTTPAAPSNFNALPDRPTVIDLSWNDNSNNETGFRIEMKQGAAGAFTAIATAGSNITNYRVVNLLAATQYTFRIRATNSAGDSTLILSTVVTTPSAGNTATFAYQFGNLIETNCLDCHGGGVTAGGVNLSNYNAVFQNRNAAYTAMNSGRMPPSGKLSAAQIASFKAWIDAGALNN